MQSGNKILLVEDDKYIALALKIRLQAEGYDVTAVYDSAEAFESVTERVPHIALIDYNLPDGNGIDVIRVFSQDSKTRNIASIIMTASNKRGLRDDAFAAGATDYFEKPFNSSDLIEAIRNACVLEHSHACQQHLHMC